MNVYPGADPKKHLPEFQYLSLSRCFLPVYVTGGGEFPAAVVLPNRPFGGARSVSISDGWRQRGQAGEGAILFAILMRSMYFVNAPMLQVFTEEWTIEAS